jgi:hypothetical protein
MRYPATEFELTSVRTKSRRTLRGPINCLHFMEAQKYPWHLCGLQFLFLLCLIKSLDMLEGGRLSSVIKPNSSAAQWPNDLPTWSSQLDTRQQTVRTTKVCCGHFRLDGALVKPTQQVPMDDPLVVPLTTLDSELQPVK